MTRSSILVLALVFSVIGEPGQAQYQQRRTRRSTPANPNAEYKDVSASFHGALKHLDNKEILILNDDDQEVVIRRSKKTKFFRDDKEVKASDIDLESRVTVEASQDVDLKPVASKVTVDSKVTEK